VRPRGSYALGDRPLTPRMRDVIRSAAAGASVNETAGELHLSESTVKTIRAAAIARLGTRTFTAAVVEAFKRGEI